MWLEQPSKVRAQATSLLRYLPQVPSYKFYLPSAIRPLNSFCKQACEHALTKSRGKGGDGEEVETWRVGGWVQGCAEFKRRARVQGILSRC